MQKGNKGNSEDNVLRILFPGRDVQVLDGRASVTVYPLALRHARKFSRELIAVIAAVSELPAKDLSKIAGDKSAAAEIMAVLGPTLLSSLIDLVEECTRFRPSEELAAELLAAGADAAAVKIGDLPHYDLPPIVEAWLEESFLGGKWMPWVRAVEDLVQRATGSRPDFSGAIERLRQPAEAGQANS